MTRLSKPTRIFLGVTLVVLICDLVTKELALFFFAGNSAPGWSGPVGLGFSLALNYGTAGGFDLGDYTREINIFSMALVGLLTITFRRTLSMMHSLAPAALGLITGAAAGNVLSLVLRPAVVDFISISAGSVAIAFNVADIAVAVGVVLLVPVGAAILMRAREERRVYGTATPRTDAPVFKRSVFEREIPIAVASEVAIRPEVRQKRDRDRQREVVISELPADFEIDELSQ